MTHAEQLRQLRAHEMRLEESIATDKAELVKLTNGLAQAADELSRVKKKIGQLTLGRMHTT